MTRRTKTGRILTDDDLEIIAVEVEKAEFTPDDVKAITQSRRSTPRIEDAKTT